MSQLWKWMTVLLVFSPADLSAAQQDTRGCERLYLIQPPSEIPCKPYVTEITEQNTSSLFLSVSMECVAALPRADQDLYGALEIVWKEKVDDGEEHEKKRDSSWITSDDSSYTVLNSVLQLRDEVTEDNVRKYWCEISFHEGPANATFTISNIATVNPPENYSSLPLCPHNTVFHLAEASCAESRQSVIDPSPSPSPSPVDAPHCSSGDETESSNLISLNAMDLTIIAIGIGASIILFIILLITCLTCLLYRKKRRKGGKQHTKSDEDISTNIAEESIHRETDTPTSPALSAVVKQNPKQNHKIALSPPTHQPVAVTSPKKRAAAQVIKPKIVPRRKNEEMGGENGLRKEPYQILDLTTVDNPHIYTTAATNSSDGDSMEEDESARNSLGISMSNAYGYVAPNDICSTQDREMYQELQPSTQDYLALYVTPSAPGMANSSMSQPIYTEPNPNA